MNGSIMMILLSFTLISGSIQAFWGYKLMRFLMALNGSVIGLAIGAVCGALMGGGDGGMIALVALVGAAAGAWMAYKLYLVGVFFMCAIWGFLSIMIITILITNDPGPAVMLGAVTAIAAGVLGTTFVKPVVIICTSIGGGIAAGGAGMILHPAFGVIVGLLCVCGGFWYQCKNNGNLFGIGSSSGKMIANPVQGSGDVVSAPSLQNVTEKLSGEFQQVKSLVNEKLIADRSSDEGGFITSKYRKNIAFINVNVQNDRELWKPGFPVVVTQAELADIDEDGSMGLYLGFQNLRKKPIIAVYVDVRCYNVLKEMKAELKDVCFLDLNIKEGQIYVITRAVSLPDKSIRRCEVFVRHVVFNDDEIWSDDGEQFVQQMEEQKELELSGLWDDFLRMAEVYVPGSSGKYRFEPMDLGDYWYCGCGQLNEAGRENCLACSIKKQDIFMLTNRKYLEEEQKIRLERERRARAEAELLAAEKRAREEALRAKRQAELQTKIDATQKKALETVEKVKKLGTVSLKRATTATESKGEKNCSQCGAPYQCGDMFCMQCGFKVGNLVNGQEAEEQKAAMDSAGHVCAKCSCTNDVDAIFCVNCGARLDGEAEL